MRILLVNPPIELFPKEFLSVVPPLGPAYIAAVLEKAGHEVKILDCLALSWRRPQVRKRGQKKICLLSPGDRFIKKYLLDFKPKIVGISNMVLINEGQVIKFARLVKKVLPQARVVIGGVNASFRAEIFIKDKSVDFVVIGEGEITMRELVENLKKQKFAKINGLVFKNSQEKAIFNPPRALIENLDSLPFPAWHLLPMEEYFHGHPAGLLYKKKRFAMVLSSRGCPFACTFCTNERFWQRKWRGRKVEKIIEEIKDLRARYQIEEIQFMDSNMSVDRKRFKKLCLALKKEKLPWIPYTGVAVMTLNRPLIRLLARSGCYALQLGIENGDSEIQRKIGKIVPLEKTQSVVDECKKVGIWVHGYFIVGLPGETLKTAFKSLDYAIKADLDSVSFFTALPLPGSKLYQQLFGNKQTDLGNLRIYLSNICCSSLTSAEMKKIIKTSFQRFFIFKLKRELHPTFFLRRLRQIKSWDNFTFYWRIFKRFLQIESILWQETI